jgi:thioesterase domain-containing protein
MSIQDEGPYLLRGYCNGGYVAYEIARRLTSRGHRSVRLRSGLPTYLSRLTLFYGDSSIWRCFPTHGWKELVKGGIEVHVAKGNHFMGLFGNPDIFILIEKCIHRSIGLRIKQLAE